MTERPTEQTHPARTLGDQCAPVGKERHLPGDFEAGRDSRDAGGRGRAAVATAGSGADLEHANLRRPATPTQVEQQRRRVVLVVELSQATFGVHAVHQHVTAGAQAGQRQVLALEVRLVVVAVPDRDALLNPEELRLAGAIPARRKSAISPWLNISIFFFDAFSLWLS